MTNEEILAREVVATVKVKDFLTHQGVKPITQFQISQLILWGMNWQRMNARQPDQRVRELEVENAQLRSMLENFPMITDDRNAEEPKS